ncbi:MAG: methyltransferase domain-containing protein [Bacteroidales bacterium]|nr:methyltransferase domain-containing protein [Bacteroidales bacterium]
MKSLEESVTGSLDGSDTAIMKFLPWLLRDLWEIGSDPETMVRLITDHVRKDNLRILDLGCGKGAVSVRLAQEPGFTVTGIDAVPEFIMEAGEYARKFNVSDRCSFKVGDIRVRIRELSGFDVVILGAIGPVFGDLEVTLKTVRGAMTNPGYVLLDDGYIEDDLVTDYNRCLRKSEFFRQISAGGFTVIKEEIFERNGLAEKDEAMFNSIKQRAEELMEQYPEKSELFRIYIENQNFETRMLETVITTGTWLLGTVCNPEK